MIWKESNPDQVRGHTILICMTGENRYDFQLLPSLQRNMLYISVSRRRTSMKSKRRLQLWRIASEKRSQPSCQEFLPFCHTLLILSLLPANLPVSPVFPHNQTPPYRRNLIHCSIYPPTIAILLLNQAAVPWLTWVGGVKCHLMSPLLQVDVEGVGRRPLWRKTV